MKKENYLKSEKGITLIALVITIVVMLILAGVTINLTLGENGIFTTAQKAAKNYTDAQNKELAQLSDFTNGLTAGKVAKTEDGVQYVGDGVGNIIPVPVGFSYLEGTKNTGFVIKNDTDGNEFVWVPIEDISNYQRIAWTREGWQSSQYIYDEKDSQNLKITDNDSSYYYTENLPADEKISVTTYRGYYIGRYETGIKDGTYSTKSIDGSRWTGQIVIQAKQIAWDWIMRDRAVTESKNLYNKENDNVTSKLCSSYAWDSALKFIEKTNSLYPTNSNGGNYDLQSGGTGAIQKTGYHVVNNIYDMGGNLWEWTTEEYSDDSKSGVIRGGTASSNSMNLPAARRDEVELTIDTSVIGFRIALFM